MKSMQSFSLYLIFTFLIVLVNKANLIKFEKNQIMSSGEIKSMVYKLKSELSK